MTDPISDMFIRIKNAQAVKHEQVSVPFSNMKFAIANLLKSKGIVANVEKRKKKTKKSEHDFISLTLKYEDGRGGLDGVKILSRPSRRLYIKASEIKPIHSGYGFAVISTPKGIMGSQEAKKSKLGGEILCEIW